MKPGKELDTLIARRIFNIREFRPEMNTFRQQERPAGPKPYSIDISAALEVAEYLAGVEDCEGFTLRCDLSADLVWSASFGDGRYEASAEKSALAVCLAALKASEDFQ